MLFAQAGAKVMLNGFGKPEEIAAAQAQMQKGGLPPGMSLPKGFGGQGMGGLQLPPGLSGLGRKK